MVPIVQMKTSRTTMLLNPSLEECVKAAVGCGMPEAEGRKFFYHYESNGWRVGKLPMKSFAGAMGGWYERWLERQSHQLVNGNGNGINGAAMVVLGREYERVITAMDKIKATYGDHQTWRERDVADWKKLATRKAELRQQLGIRV